MGTTINININDGSSSLVEKNKVDIQANREKNRTEAYQREAAEEAVKKAEKEKSKTSYYKNSTDFVTRPYKRERPEPEPTAFIPGGYPVAHGWIEKVSSSDISDDTVEETWRIYSADRSAYVDTKELYAFEPQPPKKWGAGYNTTNYYDYASAYWSYDGESYLSSSEYLRGGALNANETVVNLDNNYYSASLEKTQFPENLAIYEGRSNEEVIGITPYIKTAKTNYRFYGSQNMCFPLNSNTFVLCKFGYSLNETSYVGLKAIRTIKSNPDNCRKLIQDDGDWASTIPQKAQGAGPFVYHFSEHGYVSYILKDSLDDQFQEFYTNNQRYINTFLVSTNRVKEIPAPAQFQSAIANLVPAMVKNPRMNGTITSGEMILGTQTNYWYGPSEGGFGFDYWSQAPQGANTRYPQSVYYIEFDVFTGSDYSVSLPSRNMYTFDTGDQGPVGNLNINAFYEIPRLGFSQVLESLNYNEKSYQPAGVAQQYTPGVFDVLKNAEALRNPQGSADFPLEFEPEVFLNCYTTVQNDASAILLEYEYAKEETANGYIEEPKLKRNNIEPFEGYLPDGDVNYTFFQVWDGGKPNYCRKKLLELGFSSSDLSFQE